MNAIKAERHLRSIPGPTRPAQASQGKVGTVFVVESEVNTETSVGWILDWAGMSTQSFYRGADFLAAVKDDDRGCVLLNQRLSDVDCITVLEELERRGIEMPVILYGGARKRFSIVQPFADLTKGTADTSFGMLLLERVTRALEVADRTRAGRRRAVGARAVLAGMTKRQLEVAQRVVAGEANKVIAANLRISERTVEIHRARVMRKSECDSVAALVWLFCRAGFDQGVATWPIDEFCRQVREQPPRSG